MTDTNNDKELTTYDELGNILDKLFLYASHYKPGDELTSPITIESAIQALQALITTEVRRAASHLKGLPHTDEVGSEYRYQGFVEGIDAMVAELTSKENHEA